MNPINNQKIPIEQCLDVLRKAKKIIDDERFCEKGTKTSLKEIIAYSSREGYIQRTQKKDAEWMSKVYDQIREVNERINYGERKELIKLLERIVNIAAPTLKDSKHLKNAIKDIEHTEKGKYIWEIHLYSAIDLLKCASHITEFKHEEIFFDVYRFTKKLAL